MPIPSSIRLPRRRTIAVVVGLVSLTASSTAVANTTPLGSLQILQSAESNSTCQNPTIVQPFRAFGDRRDYVLAPGGNFEGTSAPGWQFAKGAKLVSGGRNSAGSLALPPGATAVSPGFCIDLTYPMFRFYSKAMGIAANAKINIEIVYPDVARSMFEEIKAFDGKQGTTAGSGWRLSDDIDLKPELGGKTDATRRVALRFSSEGDSSGGELRVDDIYIDPHRR